MGSAVDFRRRATDPEDLDTGVPESEALRSLADIRFVNRWLGGRSTLRAAVLPHLAASAAPSLLDVGCGSGDVAAFLADAVPRPVRAVGADLKLLHVQQVPRTRVLPVVADVHALPFPERSFDVVLASLFLHHFDGDDPAAVLARLYALCRRALVITDLRRARVPYVFGRLTFPWLFQSRVSLNDGLLSIRRAFRDDELRAQFEAAGLPHVEIRRVFPYRLLAVAARTPPY
jgi:ubiquinone/menaquinone biosynthesis C-methylase UbiE